MSELLVKLKTLTPLWTGGVDTTMDRIHETGIIGSLRWWYEAIVRGLEGSACDPTSDGKDGIPKRCPDDAGKYCDVCRVFGATGLQRSFRIDGPEWWNDERQKRLNIKVTDDNRGWYLRRGFMGEISLTFKTLRLPENLSERDLYQSLLLTMELISRWGGLGPKTQQGYGIVSATSEKFHLNVEQALQAIELLKELHNRRNINYSKELPSIENFFFSKIKIDFQGNDPEKWLKSQIKPLDKKSEKEMEWYLQKLVEKPPVLPLAPIIRYHLRDLIRAQITHGGKSNAPARWQLMGVINGLWHKNDSGKIMEKWVCEKCGRVWDHYPSSEEHRHCNGKPRKKAKYVNCNKEWNSLKDAQKDKYTEEVEHQKSLIHVSHAYLIGRNKWEFRIWGWIPDELEGGVNRQVVLEHLKNWLGVGVESKQTCLMDAENGELWKNINLNNPKICWMEKSKSEDLKDYLKRLVNFEETKNDGS